MDSKSALKPYQQIQGVYVHIPFCRQKCLYCDFNSYAGFGAEVMQDYAAAVCREIAKRQKTMPVNANASIYFGGGTPSLLPVEQTAQIVNALKKYGFWQQPREASIEANPGTVDLPKLQALRQMGFDRISFGVQSLNDEELKTIGRVHNAAEALEAVELAQKAGFKRINADVIYGLPGQTMASLKATLNKLAQTGIEHLSVYGLIVEDGTPLQKLVETGSLVLPDEDEAANMYEFVQAFLKQQGFERYEISNYARNGAYSRHNLVYWHYYPYAAFGAGACGFNGSARFTGTGTVPGYINGINAGADIYEVEQLTPAVQFEEFMFMGLRKRCGVNLLEAKERFGVDAAAKYKAQLAPFAARSLVQIDESAGKICLTEAGMEVGNQIFEIFVTD
ncbi:MAG: coproporphyrinogen III oxidase [Phascolarctobacterium sp.]|nr:MAG: coproporphyrinogen III oxidase [Phascolarctobacterium sp.]